MNKLLLITLLTLPFACFSGAERLNYQGKLAHGNSPVTDTVPMVFQIFDGQDGTNILYQESMSVDVVDGYYSIELGESPSAGELVTAIKRDDAYMQVTVNGKKLKPREKVGKPPFAKNSSDVWDSFGYTSGSLLNYSNMISDISLCETALTWGSGGLFAMAEVHEGVSSMEFNSFIFPPSHEDITVSSLQIMPQKLAGTPEGVQGWNVVANVRDIRTETLSRRLNIPVDMITVTVGDWYSIPLTNHTVNSGEFLEVFFYEEGQNTSTDIYLFIRAIVK